MVDAVPQTKTETKPAKTDATGSPDVSTQVAEPPHDALQAIRLELSGGGSRENRLERAGYTSNDQKVDWRAEFGKALANIEMLQRLQGVTGPVSDGNQMVDAGQLRNALLQDTDTHFQQALVGAGQDSSGATTQMFQKLAQVEQVDQKLNGQGGVVEQLRSAGIDPAQL